MHAKTKNNPSLSSHISVEASHGNSKQSWVRAAQSTLLAHASVASHVVVRESVSKPVDVRRVDQSRVMLYHSSSVSSIAHSKFQRSTHICHRILVVLRRSNSVRLLTRQQQSASVESSGQTRDDSVGLAVGTRGERTGRAAEDVAGCWPLEGDGVVCVRQGVIDHLAGYAAVGGLRVDRERLGRVAGPHWSDRQ